MRELYLHDVARVRCSGCDRKRVCVDVHKDPRRHRISLCAACLAQLALRLARGQAEIEAR